MYGYRQHKQFDKAVKIHQVLKDSTSYLKILLYSEFIEQQNMRELFDYGVFIFVVGPRRAAFPLHKIFNINLILGIDYLIMLIIDY